VDVNNKTNKQTKGISGSSPFARPLPLPIQRLAIPSLVVSKVAALQTALRAEENLVLGRLIFDSEKEW
jgi:hypothetical protein